jgi:cytidine deaminase
MHFPKQNLDSLSGADRELIRIAGEHAKARYKEYFISIGGALRTKSGQIYTGINLKYGVRNVSACAETMAIHKALDGGETNMDTVVGVKYFPETDSYEIVNGCGWCRQLFCYNAPLKIITSSNGKIEVREAEDLLPLAFL